MSQAGRAVVHAQVSDLRREYDDLASLLETLHCLVEWKPTLTTSSDMARRIARILVEETSFNLCAVFVAGDDPGLPRPFSGFALKGYSADIASEEETLLGSESPLGPFARKVMKLKSMQLLQDAPMGGFVPKLLDVSSHFWTLVGFPLGDWGCAVLADPENRPFSRDQKRCWAIFSDLAGKILSEGPALPGGRLPGEALRRELEYEERNLFRGSEALQAAESLLDAVMDLIPQGMCFLAEDGRMVQANRRLAQLLDGRSAEVLGQSPEIFFRRPEDFKELKIRADRDGSGRSSDLALCGRNKAIFSADVFLANISHVRHPSIRYVLLVEDISEKKAFSDQLLRTEKLAALGTMAGGVAHDFNNILMSILGNTQLLAQEIPPGCDGAERRLRSIEQAVTDGSHIVRRLQQFTEKESARGRGKRETDLRSAVIDTLELTRPRWKNTVERAGNTIEVRTDLQEGVLGAIHPADLREVLTNLVFNAVDAMPRGGRLSFRAFRRSDRAILEVSDTGMGMDETTMEKIFDPFFSTKGTGNSGLGLSVCRSLIHRMGGEMHVWSEPGKGTTFTIDLPAVEKDARDENPCLELKLKTAGKNLLVVDDEREILELLRDMLRLMGHRVTATHDPAQALSHLETATFDLVLTDLAMPEVSGWDVAKAAKAARESLPVILVTGWGAQYEGEDLRDKGVDLVLSKPLSYQKLLESLSRFV